MFRKILAAVLCLLIIGCTVLICTHIKPSRSAGTVLGQAVDQAVEDVTSFSTGTINKVRDTAEHLWNQLGGSRP